MYNRIYLAGMVVGSVAVKDRAGYDGLIVTFKIVVNSYGYQEWVKIRMGGQNAVNAAAYLHSGSHIFVEGRIHTTIYRFKDGGVKYIKEVIPTMFRILKRKNENQRLQDA